MGVWVRCTRCITSVTVTATGRGSPGAPPRWRLSMRAAMERRPYLFGHAEGVTDDPRFGPSSLGGAGWCGRRWNAVPTAGSDRSVASPIWPRRSAALPLRSQQVATLPWFRAGGGWFSPRDRVTKIRTRRCQRSIWRSPSQFLSRGTWESIPHSPAGFKRGFGKLKFCARVRGG